MGWDRGKLYLYDPSRAEWIAIFDGFTLGQERGDAKFAVDLEKRSHHCVFRLLGRGKLQLVDMSPPGTTLLNGDDVPFAVEVDLAEGDCIRINRRDLYVTHGKTLPKHRAEKKKEAAADTAGAAGNSVRAGARKSSGDGRSIPGGLGGGGPQPEGGPGALAAFAARARVLWSSVVETLPERKKILEPLLAMLVAAALGLISYDKLHVSGAPSLPHRDLASEETPLPSENLSAKAPDVAQPLPDPSPADLAHFLPPAPNLADYLPSPLPVPTASQMAAPRPSDVPLAKAVPVATATPSLPNPRVTPSPVALVLPAAAENPPDMNNSAYAKSLFAPQAQAWPGPAIAAPPAEPAEEAAAAAPAPRKPPCRRDTRNTRIVGADAINLGGVGQNGFLANVGSADCDGNDVGGAGAGVSTVSFGGGGGGGNGGPTGNRNAGVAGGGRKAALTPLDAVPGRAPASASLHASSAAASYGGESDDNDGIPTRRFDRPMIERGGQKYRLDWCLQWESGCGKPAADAFCKEMGLVGSVSIGIQPQVGGGDRLTALIGDSGVYCPGTHDGHRCDGFEFIECREK